MDLLGPDHKPAEPDDIDAHWHDDDEPFLTILAEVLAVFVALSGLVLLGIWMVAKP